MRFTLLAFALMAVTSACGGQSAAPAAAPTAPEPAETAAPSASDGPAGPAAPAGSAAAPAHDPAPKCVAMGKPCTVGETYCCYGSCRVDNGSATPVCAP